jgi:fumarylpyruvate hydrolase
LDLGMDRENWPSLSVLGRDDRFTVRRVWCIGRNYVDHAKEMGETGDKPPLVFAKNPMGVVGVAEGEEGGIVYPSETTELHHEVEWVLAIGTGGVVIGSAVGIDMTRRDLQRQMKDRRGPWAVAKDFEDSAPVGPIVLGVVPSRGRISLSVDGELRQCGDLSLMICDATAVVAMLNRLCPLAAGDLIFTGTPAGVGSVRRGQLMEAEIEAVGVLSVRVR